MTKKILVVDDEPHIAKAIELALSGQGYDIKRASNADEAWKLIDENTDLILLDLMMPGTRPVDLIRNIRDHELTKIKCMYVSAVPFTNDQKEKMIKEGVIVDFIQKPFDNDDLLKRVKTALGEQ
ncbi:Regulator of RpoS [uncultured archaeon]|nr:Regulator of RpoS [uncultured archaeon]